MTSLPIPDRAHTRALLVRLKSAASLTEAILARNTLIEHHLPLADVVVKTTLPKAPKALRDDARQEAICALIEVCGRVGPEHATHFGAYAFVAMRNRLYGFLATQSPVVANVRASRNLRRLRRHLTDSGDSLESLSDSDLAKAAGVSRCAVRRLRPWVYRSGHTEEPHNGTDIDPGFPICGSANGIHPLERLTLHDDLARMHDSLARLPLADQQLLARVFGLNGEEPQTLPMCAAIAGYSRQRALFRFNRAIARIRRLWPDALVPEPVKAS